MAKTLELAVPFQLDRTFSPRLAGQFAQMLEASGVVDYFQVWDQTCSWFPRALWSPETTPLATTLPDCDSYADAFLLGAYGTAATENLGVAISTDAIRRG